MKPMKPSRAVYLGLVALLITACASSPATATSVPASSAADRALRASASPLPAGDQLKSNKPGLAVASSAAGSTLHRARTPQVPSVGCPILVENPVGCPVPQPGPNLPPIGQARIAICRPAVSVSGLSSLAVCGVGFHASEVVVISVVGRIGSLAFQTVASPSGGFDVPLPRSACQIMPLSIRARGNRGTVSNVVTVPPYACIGH